MRRVREVIVVEGKYDANQLAQVVDATILQTDGFGVFSNREKIDLLRRLGEKRGLILLTDSDSAGFLIRNHLKGQLQGVPIKQAYIPDRYGKERRKRQTSKEGKLGVEGMDRETILQALDRCGATWEDGGKMPQRAEITKADFYRLGLSGHPESGARRAKLLQKLDLPARLTANGLLEICNALYTREDFLRLAKELEQETIS